MFAADSLKTTSFEPVDQTPPSNIEVEEAILGGILLDPAAIDRVADVLTPESFYLTANQYIFRGAIALHEEGTTCDLMSVSSWLQDQKLLEKAGGPFRLTQLLESTVSAVNIDRYALLVQEKYRRRQFIQAAAVIESIGRSTEISIEEAEQKAEQALFQVTQSGFGPRDNLHKVSDFLPDFFNDLEGRALGKVVPGVPCGFRDLDALTQGFQRSDLIIAAGRPAMGKTSFVLNIAHHVAKNRLPVVIYSLEMSKEQLTQRLLSAESKVESDRLRNGKLSGQEWDAVTNALGVLDDIPLVISDNADLHINTVRSQLRKVKSQHKGKLGLVVIDYLQLMQTAGTNRVQELAQITRSLKAMAKELQVPVILLSQLSRGVESRTNKRPVMSDLRESGAIEQDADLVLMLYRDEYYNPDTPDRGIAEVIITKHRNGPVGTVKLLFSPEYTRFCNLSTSNDKP